MKKSLKLIVIFFIFIMLGGISNVEATGGGGLGMTQIVEDSKKNHLAGYEERKIIDSYPYSGTCTVYVKKEKLIEVKRKGNETLTYQYIHDSNKEFYFVIEDKIIRTSDGDNQAGINLFQNDTNDKNWLCTVKKKTSVTTGNFKLEFVSVVQNFYKFKLTINKDAEDFTIVAKDAGGNSGQASCRILRFDNITDEVIYKNMHIKEMDLAHELVNNCEKNGIEYEYKAIARLQKVGIDLANTQELFDKINNVNYTISPGSEVGVDILYEKGSKLSDDADPIKIPIRSGGMADSNRFIDSTMTSDGCTHIYMTEEMMKNRNNCNNTWNDADKNKIDDRVDMIEKELEAYNEKHPAAKLEKISEKHLEGEVGIAKFEKIILDDTGQYDIVEAKGDENWDVANVDYYAYMIYEKDGKVVKADWIQLTYAIYPFRDEVVVYGFANEIYDGEELVNVEDIKNESESTTTAGEDSAKAATFATQIMLSTIIESDKRQQSQFKDVLTEMDYYEDDIEKEKNTNSTEFTQKVNVIITIITNIGMVSSILILAILGIKYMLGSVEEKAEYKKDLIPYIVGVFLLFGIITIVKILQQFGESINKL